MSRSRALLARLFRPGLPPLLLLTALCVPAVPYALTRETPAAYPVYALSAYTLAAWAVRVPAAARRIRAAVYHNRWGWRYLTDLPFRGRVSLHVSTAVNLCYALFKLWAGVSYRSVWFGAVAVYYLVLTAARALLLRSIRRGEPDLRREYRSARLCGWLLLALNLALSAMTVQMVLHGQGYAYPGYLIFAAALYAFYAAAFSIRNLIRFRRLNSPVLAASKVLGVATALVSMLSLQTAMFASFGSNFAHRRLMNALVGGAVCLLILLMAALMILGSGQALRRCGAGAPGPYPTMEEHPNGRQP